MTELLDIYQNNIDAGYYLLSNGNNDIKLQIQIISINNNDVSSIVRVAPMIKYIFQIRINSMPKTQPLNTLNLNNITFTPIKYQSFQIELSADNKYYRYQSSVNTTDNNFSSKIPVNSLYNMLDLYTFNFFTDLSVVSIPSMNINQYLVIKCYLIGLLDKIVI